VVARAGLVKLDFRITELLQLGYRFFLNFFKPFAQALFY
tara:strand:+ start:337 stop:453 length:117 start_codon:yes stop_codon:yes gene_type:complete